VKRSRPMAWVLGLCVVSTAAAQNAGAPSGDLTDPVEILKKADAACKAAKFVQYTASFKGLNAEEARAPKVSGTVVLSGWANGRPEKWRYDLKIERPGSSDVSEATAGSDGKTFFVIDPKTKKAYEDIDPAVLGSTGRAVRGVTMAEFVHNEPFSDEINGEKQELKGVTKVGDEDCYEVLVKYKAQAQEATWFFSKKDFLPRRVDRVFTNQAGEKGGSQLIVTKLTVGPKFDNDPFKLVVPEGFTKTDDFAP